MQHFSSQRRRDVGEGVFGTKQLVSSLYESISNFMFLSVPEENLFFCSAAFAPSYSDFDVLRDVPLTASEKLHSIRQIFSICTSEGCFSTFYYPPSPPPACLISFDV